MKKSKMIKVLMEWGACLVFVLGIVVCAAEVDEDCSGTVFLVKMLVGVGLCVLSAVVFNIIKRDWDE